MKFLLVLMVVMFSSSCAFADDFVFVKGGKFLMGSPESENWRSDDELQHEVTINDFYISCYEVTQSEYENLIGSNPSTFHGDNKPVENVTWLEAVEFCNAKSMAENLTPVYSIEANKVTWDLSAEGYTVQELPRLLISSTQSELTKQIFTDIIPMRSRKIISHSRNFQLNPEFTEAKLSM